MMLRLSLAATLLVVSFGCQRPYLDVDGKATHWEARDDHQRAQRRYRQLLRSAKRPAQRDRWRLALASSILASRPAGDPKAGARALAILRQAESAQRSATRRRLLALAQTLEQLEKSSGYERRVRALERELLLADKKKVELEQELANAQRAFAELLAAHSKATEQGQLQLEQIEQLKTKLKRLRDAHEKELGEQKKRLWRLQRKLSALKRIDMQRRP
jgi:DNA repair exonuclease SbcCD ATPase subunit